MIKASKEDMALLLSCTVRYCLGRQSYIVSSCWDLINRYGPDMEAFRLSQFAKEIGEEIDRNLQLPLRDEWRKTEALCRQLANSKRRSSE